MITTSEVLYWKLLDKHRICHYLKEETKESPPQPQMLHLALPRMQRAGKAKDAADSEKETISPCKYVKLPPRYMPLFHCSMLDLPTTLIQEQLDCPSDHDCQLATEPSEEGWNGSDYPEE